MLTLQKYQNKLHKMKNKGDVWAKKPGFVTSLDISAHPLLKKARKKRLLYFSVLEYLVNSCVLDLDVEYANARLSQYRSSLAGEETVISLQKKDSVKAIQKVAGDFLPWNWGNSFMLLCDTALIISHEPGVKKACGMIAKFLNRRKQAKLNDLFAALYNDKPIPRMLFVNVENLINQFRLNRDFTARREMRIMVTGNVGAGKSALINAIVGKPVMKMNDVEGGEGCTKNLCYIHNKPFEDNRFHLNASSLNLKAEPGDLLSAEKKPNCVIASYFRALDHTNARVCLIDTPAVNSSPGLREITHNAIADGKYDKLICVLNEEEHGTKATIKHLKYIRMKVPPEKVIFVLNKLDDFDSEEDPILESIKSYEDDLVKYVYKKQVIRIHPLSAKFSLLLKKKNNEKLGEDERILFNRIEKKLSKQEYDLSNGLRDFENTLYGGYENEKSIH